MAPQRYVYDLLPVSCVPRAAPELRCTIFCRCMLCCPQMVLQRKERATCCGRPVLQVASRDYFVAGVQRPIVGASTKRGEVPYIKSVEIAWKRMIMQEYLYA